jgi:hypothetical protein
MCGRYETLCSIFIGGVSRKNDLEEIAPAILLVHTTCEDGTDRMFRNVST